MKDARKTDPRGQGEPAGSSAGGGRQKRRGPNSASARSSLVLAKRLRETLDNMLEGCQIIGFDWRYLYVNDAAAAHGRTTKENLLDKTMMEAYPGIENTEMYAALRRCMEERVPARLENEFTYPDGETGWFELRIEPAPEGILILSADISDRKRTEESLRRTARALRTISGCHRAEAGATEEIELLQEVCRVIVEEAGYRRAWIALAGHEEKGIAPVAYAGCGEVDLERANVTGADVLKGPAALAMSAGKPVISSNIQSDPRFASWREEAIRWGYASCIALPLVANREVLGVLNICAPGSQAFDGEEEEILEGLADGVAQGLAGLRARARTGVLHGELAKLEHQYALHFGQVSDVIYSLDRQLRLQTISPSVETLLGYAPEELIGRPFGELGIVSADSMKAATADAARVLSGGRISASVYELMAKDGTRRFVEMSGAPIFEGEEILGVVSVARDVTDRMGTERALEHTLNDLRQVLGGMVNILGLIVEQRDPYTAGHQKRVANLARAIATEMGVPLSRIGGIRVAGSIHDLGKVSVPAEILSRPGPLSEHELKLVQSHPQIGYELLKEVEFPWPIADIVLQHHERLDGSGYPNHLRSQEILLEARILALADVVDAMASHRPYRPAFAVEEVMSEISRERGALYDPEAVDACLRLFMEKGFQLG